MEEVEAHPRLNQATLLPQARALGWAGPALGQWGSRVPSLEVECLPWDHQECLGWGPLRPWAGVGLGVACPLPGWVEDLLVPRADRDLARGPWGRVAPGDRDREASWDREAPGTRDRAVPGDLLAPWGRVGLVGQDWQAPWDRAVPAPVPCSRASSKEGQGRNRASLSSTQTSSEPCCSR